MIHCPDLGIGHRTTARFAGRLRLAAALGCLGLCALSRAALGQTSAKPAPIPADWMRIAPGEARFYVEIRGLADIRRLFRSLGIWDIVRELAESRTPGAAKQPWQRSAQALLGLDPDAAIREILGRRTALIASQSADWQNGVLVAELNDPADLPALLKRWSAAPTEDEGPVRRFTLRGGIKLAARDSIILLGPTGDADGLWSRAVLLLAGKRGPNLAARSEVAALRVRLSRDYPTLMYVAWNEGDPTAIAGCTRLLIGAEVASSAITSEWRGQLARREQRLATTHVAGSLPATTIAAWSSAADFAELTRRAKERQFELTGSFFDLFASSLASIDESSGRIIQSLGPSYTVVVGSRPASSAPGIDLPVIAALCSTREGRAPIEQLDLLMTFFSQMFAAVAGSAKEADRAAEGPMKSVCEGLEIHHVNLGGSLARWLEADLLADLHVCWADLGDRLLISTSLGHAEDIIKSLRNKAPRLEERGGADLAGSNESPVSEWLHLRGTVAAGLLSRWTSYLRQRHPTAVSSEWWRQWASRRVERRTRLGVGLETSPTNARYAVVSEISDSSLAVDQLHVGDVIVAVGGRPLATTRPAEEVADRYRQRAGVTSFDLRILRDGELMDIRVPVLPADAIDLREFDPVRAVEQLIILTRRVDTLTLLRYAGKPERLDARLVIRWEQNPPT